MAAWVAHWNCNFGAQRGNLVVWGSSPGWGAKHFSILSVLFSAAFPGEILIFNGNVQTWQNSNHICYIDIEFEFQALMPVNNIL